MDFVQIQALFAPRCRVSRKKSNAERCETGKKTPFSLYVRTPWPLRVSPSQLRPLSPLVLGSIDPLSALESFPVTIRISAAGPRGARQSGLHSLRGQYASRFKRDER
jgi:hypothetical protein